MSFGPCAHPWSTGAVLCANLVLVFACAGSAPVSEAAHLQAEQRQGAPAPVPPGAPSGAPAQAPTEAQPAPRSPSSGPPLEQVTSKRLSLPSQPAFVASPLPAADVDRYARLRESTRIVVGQSHLQQLDLLPDNLLLTARAGEGNVRVYDRGSKRLVKELALTRLGEDSRLAVLAWPEPVGHAAAFVAAVGRGLTLHAAVSGELLAVLDTTFVQALKWSADRGVLVGVVSNLEQQTSQLHFWGRSGSKLTPLGSLDFEERVDGWDLSRDNALLALSHYPSGDVRVLDLATGLDVLRLPGPRYAGSVALSADGRFLAVGGEGLLVVDLLNPSRRAHYSYFYNGISQVQFTPSADAVVASSFDGRLRVFELERVPEALPAAGEARTGALRLSLLRTLRHAANANVYAFTFDTEGDALWSVSGDQTVRGFSASRVAAASAPAKAENGRRYRTLAAWREAEPSWAKPWPPPPEPPRSQGRVVPQVLRQPARPARLASGKYACKLGTLYKLRQCVVTRDGAGHTRLVFASDNLLALEAVVWDEGPHLRFEAWLNEPSTVVGCAGCERQPLHGLLRGQGGRYQGLLTYRNYYDPYAPPEAPPLDARVEEASDRLPITLVLERASRE